MVHLRCPENRESLIRRLTTAGRRTKHQHCKLEGEIMTPSNKCKGRKRNDDFERGKDRDSGRERARAGGRTTRRGIFRSWKD